MGRLAPLAALGLLGIANTAMAACPYDSGQMLDDMLAAEDALRANDDGTVVTAAARLEEGLGCLTEVLPQSSLYARAYRVVAAGAMADNDEGKARGWMLTAVEIDSGFTYGSEDLSSDHDVRLVYEEIKIFGQPPAEPLADAAFSGGTVLLDGSEISTPSAIAGRPHVVQLKTDSGVQSWVIKGNAFPPEVLGTAGGDEAGGKKGKKDKKDKDNAADGSSGGGDGLVGVLGWEKTQPVIPGCRFKRGDGSCVPPSKLPMLGAGVLILGASAGVYLMTNGTVEDFKGAQTPAMIDKHADKTNRLVLISGGLAVVGVAGLTWGIVLDADGQPVGPSMQMRW